MKMYSLKCPDCGAMLEIEEDRDVCFCSYCGTKILVSDENSKRIRITDEAKIREAEAKERIELEKMEREGRTSKRTTIVIVALIVMYFLFMLYLLNR